MYRCDKCGIQSVAAAICTSCGDDLKRVGPARVSYIVGICAHGCDIPSRFVGPFGSITEAEDWWDYFSQSAENEGCAYFVDVLEGP